MPLIWSAKYKVRLNHAHPTTPRRRRTIKRRRRRRRKVITAPNMEPCVTSICPVPTKPRDTIDEPFRLREMPPPPVAPSDEEDPDAEKDRSRTEPREFDRLPIPSTEISEDCDPRGVDIDRCCTPPPPDTRLPRGCNPFGDLIDPLVTEIPPPAWNPFLLVANVTLLGTTSTPWLLRQLK